MKINIVWFVIAVIFADFCSAQESFFSNPHFISQEEVARDLDVKSLNMCWQFGENDYFRFVSKKEKIYFEILFKELPSSYEDLRSSFIDQEIKGQNHFVFSYEWHSDGSFVLKPSFWQKEGNLSKSSAYLVEDFLISQDLQTLIPSVASQVLNPNYDKEAE